jgi:hypothetical protein
MKKQILNIAVFAILAITTPLALAEGPSFPEVGTRYGISWAQDALTSPFQIKVIRKGDGPWILAESSYYVARSLSSPDAVRAPGDTEPQPTPEKPSVTTRTQWINTQWIVSAIEVAPSAESSTASGYKEGFVAGRTGHNHKEQSLDALSIAAMASLQGKVHADGDQSRSASDYEKGWTKGYADGFRAPIPDLPIHVPREPKHTSKNLGSCKANEPLKSLSALTKEFADKDLFIVDGTVTLNENSSEHVKVIYDRKERIYLKLTRIELLGQVDSEWFLRIDIGADELTEKNLSDSNAKHQTVRYKSNEDKTSAPLIYTTDPKLTDWP